MKGLPNTHKEIGWFPIRKTAESGQSRLAACIPDEMYVFHWHGDTFDLPSGAVHLARSMGCENQGFIYEERIIALQFHLETTQPSARSLIENCGEEILDGPYIQTPAVMLADEQRFVMANAIMKKVFDQIAARFA